MSILNKFDRHSNLVSKMADTLGADIVDAAMRGSVPETAIRSAVYGCMTCKDPDACEHWLADHPDGADHTPDYCRNKAMLERLSKE